MERKMETLSEAISNIVGEEIDNLFKQIGCDSGCIHQEIKSLNAVEEITHRVKNAVKVCIEKVENPSYCDTCETKDEDSYGLMCDWSCGKWTAHVQRQMMKEKIIESLGCPT
jgi:hypothetical protein